MQSLLLYSITSGTDTKQMNDFKYLNHWHWTNSVFCHSTRNSIELCKCVKFLFLTDTLCQSATSESTITSELWKHICKTNSRLDKSLHKINCLRIITIPFLDDNSSLVSHVYVNQKLQTSIGISMNRSHLRECCSFWKTTHSLTLVLPSTSI